MTAGWQSEVIEVIVVSYTQREKSVRKNITDSFRTGTAANHRNLTNLKKPPTVVRFLPGRHPR
jgi:hypothetical protein